MAVEPIRSMPHYGDSNTSIPLGSGCASTDSPAGRMRVALAAAEIQLQNELARARSHADHAGGRGDRIEAAVRSFLTNHLPRRLDVGTGEIIDSAGNRSAQTDLIVSNEDQPLRWNSEEHGLYFVEGVAAAGEVKARLTTAGLDDCMEKGRKGKALTPRTEAAISLGQPRDSTPFFVIAFESEVATDSVLARLVEGAGSNLDAVFILGTGSFIRVADDQPLKFTNDPGARGWMFVDKQDGVLLLMLLWLHLATPGQLLGSTPVLGTYLLPLNIAQGRWRGAPGSPEVAPSDSAPDANGHS